MWGELPVRMSRPSRTGTWACKMCFAFPLCAFWLCFLWCCCSSKSRPWRTTRKPAAWRKRRGTWGRCSESEVHAVPDYFFGLLGGLLAGVYRFAALHHGIHQPACRRGIDFGYGCVVGDLPANLDQLLDARPALVQCDYHRHSDFISGLVDCGVPSRDMDGGADAVRRCTGRNDAVAQVLRICFPAGAAGTAG